VLSLLAQGLGDEDISERLSISRNTVKNHMSAIYKVTGVRKRAALVVWARERGLGTQTKAPIKQRRTKPRLAHPVE
jgi:DNA-binding NarL/FixJ family response regulator